MKMENQILSDVCKYLDTYGWKYESTDDKKLLTRFFGEDSDTEFNLIITVGENWVGFTIWPYIFSVESEKIGEIAKKISFINYDDIKMARFAQTKKGEVVLCVDLPVQGLNEAVFHRAIDVLSYYAETYYPAFLELWG